jgi:hypothetical protein
MDTMADTTLLSLDAFSLARGKAEVLDNVGFTLGR